MSELRQCHLEEEEEEEEEKQQGCWIKCACEGN
jgi:hypothetical protein